MLVAALGLAGNALAQPPDASPLSDEEIDRRLAFIERRLEDGKLRGQLWQYGWTAVDVFGVVSGTAQAVRTDDRDQRVRNIVDSVKSASSMVQMSLDPTPVRLGAAPIRALPDATREQRLARLAAAENLLKGNAERAAMRHQLKPHLLNLASNLATGAIIWALADSRNALMSTVPAILVGEARIWTHPHRAERDLAEYRARFGHARLPARGLAWSVSPTYGGLTVTVRF